MSSVKALAIIGIALALFDLALISSHVLAYGY